MDRVEPEAWTEMGGIGAEAVIGIGAEHDQPLDEEKEREPRRPDHEWDAGDLDRFLDLVLLVLDVLAVARAPCRHHLPLLASRRQFASEHTPCRMVLSSATGRWCSRASSRRTRRITDSFKDEYFLGVAHCVAWAAAPEFGQSTNAALAALKQRAED